jgi:2,3-bisphosphoglycerate-independent phosphoglycerate mutase
LNKKVILIILDGWGIPKAGEEWRSAIDKANVNYYRELLAKYPHSQLEACGLAVGLPDGQMGNSEVGHTNLGAGRIVYQDLVKINKAVAEGTLASEPVLVEALEYAKSNNKKVHFIGLVSDGGVHSHIDHLKALCSIAAENGLENVFIHAFMDGRDTDPKSGVGYMQDLQNHLDKSTGKVASVIGRFYAMDRDKRWERVAEAYQLLVNGEGKKEKGEGIIAAIENSYVEGITDEFIKPIVVVGADNQPIGLIEEGDVVLSYNYRTDRGREITMALNQQDFPDFGMKKLNLNYITMTNYDESFVGVKVIYDKDNLNNTIGEVVANAGRSQIRIAETEKYPHVTFFFSGGREEPFDKESRILCPSPKDVKTYDLKPQMASREIGEGIVAELKKGEVDFVCLNFAAPDMVGHTGVVEAVITAVETVDAALKDVVETGLANGYTSIVIADHGNADYMTNDDGTPNTAHSLNLVPCIVVDKEWRGEVKNGKLADVAPTILKLMGIGKPAEMTGDELI